MSESKSAESLLGQHPAASPLRERSTEQGKISSLHREALRIARQLKAPGRPGKGPPRPQLCPLSYCYSLERSAPGSSLQIHSRASDLWHRKVTDGPHRTVSGTLIFAHLLKTNCWTRAWEMCLLGSSRRVFELVFKYSLTPTLGQPQRLASHCSCPGGFMVQQREMLKHS